uniref:Uncharacterized protein n=1 Tax=Archaeoglobus fulgidus TaxID=2234 RepID=A0A7J2TJX4_ARCFL
MLDLNWTEKATKIGLLFLEIWNRKKQVFPILLAISAAAWFIHYEFPNLITLHLALIPTIATLLLAFIGLIVIENIESSGDLTVVPSLVTRTIFAVAAVLLTLFYLSGMLFGIFPAPPLPLLLALMFSMAVAPIVTILVLIPPLLGYIPRFRPRWIALRKKVPFWGIYLGFIAGTLMILPLLLFVELAFLGYMYLMAIYSSVLFYCSFLLLVAPRPMITKAAGLLMILMGPISWFGAAGGLGLGSVLSVISGAYSFAWSPYGEDEEIRIKSKILEKTRKVKEVVGR